MEFTSIVTDLFANGVLNNYLFLTIRYVLNKKKVVLLRAADWKNHS